MSQGNTHKVLFIAGPGRSGSTLLDILLGQIDGFCSTGELRFIWKRGFKQNQLCGCGQPFRECEFWTKVVEEAFGGFEQVDHKRLEELRYSAEHNISNGTTLERDPNSLAPYEDYFEACRKIYQAIRRVSGCEYIVDSSKNVFNGFVLSNIAELDLFTVHLIRDSRAVAYSWQRKKVRPEILSEQRYMSRRGVLKSASRWNSRNRLAKKLQDTSRQYAVLRYEDLVNHPKESLSKIMAEFQIEGVSLDFLNDHRALLQTSHTVSGNPVRFVRDQIDIQPDLQWQRAMDRPHKWLVTVLTLPLLLKYGYLHNGHKGGIREKAL